MFLGNSPHHSPENEQQLSNHSILNFDEDDVGQEVEEKTVQEVKHVDVQSRSTNWSLPGLESSRHDTRPRLEFIESQRNKLQEYRKQAESPTRILRNPNKAEQDLDFSQFGQEEEKQEFSYHIDGSPVSLSKLDFDEPEMPEKKEQHQFAIRREMFGLSRILDAEELGGQQVQKLQKAKSVQFADLQQPSLTKQGPSLQAPMQQPSLQQQPRAPKVLVDINITDMKSWLHSPVPEGYILRCTIERDNSGMGHLYPKYHLHLSESGQYLMTAKRLAMQKTAKYILSYDKTDLSRRSPKYLGLIRSNFLGTEFMVYDPGLNPKVTQDLSLLRSQLALITFESNVLQTRTPRKIRVVLPGIIEEQSIRYRPLQSREGIILESQYPKKRNETFFEFLNKMPIWDKKANGYILYFTDRVNQASVKNFQLFQVDPFGHPMYQGESIVQFGRHKKQGFNLDVQYPFSPLQAFALCVANFDYKLACE